MSRAQKAVVRATGTILSFAFAHGEGFDADFTSLPPEIQTQLGIYGLRQKLQDSYSGKPDPREAMETAQGTLARLASGEWTATRAAGESASSTSKLLQALVRISGKTEQEVSAILENLSEDQIKGLRARADVKLTLAQIRTEELEKALAKEDGSESLTSLFG